MSKKSFCRQKKKQVTEGFAVDFSLNYSEFFACINIVCVLSQVYI